MVATITYTCFFNVNENVAPLPGLLRTLMVCLCASMMCFTIANPKPVPPWFLERLLSTR